MSSQRQNGTIFYWVRSSDQSAQFFDSEGREIASGCLHRTYLRVDIDGLEWRCRFGSTGHVGLLPAQGLAARADGSHVYEISMNPNFMSVRSADSEEFSEITMFPEGPEGPPRDRELAFVKDYMRNYLSVKLPGVGSSIRGLISKRLPFAEGTYSTDSIPLWLGLVLFEMQYRPFRSRN